MLLKFLTHSTLQEQQEKEDFWILPLNFHLTKSFELIRHDLDHILGMYT